MVALGPATRMSKMMEQMKDVVMDGVENMDDRLLDMIRGIKHWT